MMTEFERSLPAVGMTRRCETESWAGAAKIWDTGKYSSAAPAPDHTRIHFVILTKR